MRVDNLRLKVVALIGFTLVCVVAFVYLFQQAGGRLRFHKPYTISTIVPDALNIVNDSDVRESGIKVGRVRKIDPNGDNSKITFEIEDKAHNKVYSNATVRVRTKTLVGESYIDLDPGKPGPGIKQVPTGAVLPVDDSQEVVPLERILNSLDAPTRKDIQLNLKGIGQGLVGHGTDLNQLFGYAHTTVEDGGKLMQVLQPQKQDLAALIQQTGIVTGALGEREAALRSLAIDAKTTADAVNTRDDQLRQTIRSIPALLKQAQSSVGTLSSFAVKATPVVHNLKLSAVNLAPAIQDLGPVAHDTRTLFRELNPFLKKFNPVLQQLGPASNHLSTVVGPLDAFLRQANPAMAYLSPYSKELGTFFANTGSVVGMKDAYGYKARAFAEISADDYTGLTPTEQQFMNALLGVTGVDKTYQTRRNPLPKPGTAGDPQPSDGVYPNVEADK